VSRRLRLGFFLWARRLQHRTIVANIRAAAQKIFAGPGTRRRSCCGRRRLPVCSFRPLARNTPAACAPSGHFVRFRLIGKRSATPPGAQNWRSCSVPAQKLLKTSPLDSSCRQQAAGDGRLAACAPRNYALRKFDVCGVRCSG
jgi:hypothetical protein